MYSYRAIFSSYIPFCPSRSYSEPISGRAYLSSHRFTYSFIFIIFHSVVIFLAAANLHSNRIFSALTVIFERIIICNLHLPSRVFKNLSKAKLNLKYISSITYSIKFKCCQLKTQYIKFKSKTNYHLNFNIKYLF